MLTLSNAAVQRVNLNTEEEGQASPVSLTWLPDKFRVSWSFGLREEVQHWFSRWRPSWISNQTNLNYFLIYKSPRYFQWTVLFSGRSNKMSFVFICQARSLFIELLIFWCFGDKKKLILLTYLRILCKLLELTVCIALDKVLFFF